MNTQNQSTNGERQLETLVEELFKHAAPRPQPPPAVAEEVRAALKREWDEVASRRTRRARLGWLAAAASLLIMAGAATLALRPQLLFPEPVALASIERVTGELWLSEDGEPVRAVVSAGLELEQGQTLTTAADAMVAVRLFSGGSVRLDAESTVTLGEGARIELASGALYFDSHADSLPNGRLTVATPFGEVRDVGTQFVARITSATLAVSVREGLVTVSRGKEELVASVGERLTVGSLGEPVSREAIPTFGEDWRWTERIAPALEIQGRRLIEVLAWFARETGRELEFGSLDARRIAGEATLHQSGSVDLERLTALTGLLASSDLEHRLVGAKIYVTVRAR